MNAVEQMLDLRAVKARLFVSPRKIWRLVASGNFPRPVKVGSSSRWFESEIADCQQKLRNSR